MPDHGQDPARPRAGPVRCAACRTRCELRYAVRALVMVRAQAVVRAQTVMSAITQVAMVFQWATPRWCAGWVRYDCSASASSTRLLMAKS